MQLLWVFDNLILEDKAVFQFRRSRRPPLKLTNALLSYLYTLLAHECSSVIETVGLDPQAVFPSTSCRTIELSFRLNRRT
ncbi:MAG: hypothetical protein GX994_05130 [Firmicutes bacterium]|nr:hypothetical protein [Bacillota bacterium]